MEYLAQALKQAARVARVLLLHAGPGPAEDRRAGRPGVPHLQRVGRGEGSRGAEGAGGVLMRWPWRQQARPIEPIKRDLTYLACCFIGLD